MKKLLIIVLAIPGFGINSMYAQSKIAYIDATTILYLMPEMKTVTDSLAVFNKELEAEAKEQMDQYQALRKKYEDQVKNGASEAMLQLTAEEIVQKEQFINDSQQKYQMAFSEVEAALVTPLKEKFLKAVKELAIEKGINYIFDSSPGLLLNLDEKDNLDKDIRKKLGIAEDAKLPGTEGR